MLHRAARLFLNGVFTLTTELLQRSLPGSATSSRLIIAWVESARGAVQQHTSILQRIKRTVNWIGHSLCRNCLLRHVTEGEMERRIEVSEDGGEDVRNYLMIKEKSGNLKLNEEALDCIL